MAVLTTGDSWEIPKTGTPHIDHVGGSVTAPVPLTTPEAKYTPDARKAKINGICLVSLIVDRHGLPQNIRIVKTLDPGLDQNAVDAIAKYRFKPAMKNGEPVMVPITIEVNFKIY
jgi:TonB family protein